MISRTVLQNGMPLVEMPVAGRAATAVAVVFPAGARHETLDEVGVAHLLEHLAFKGTEQHPTATELNRAAEYLGTELDGVSTTQYVEFSTTVRADGAMAVIELLAEVTGTPLLATAEIEAERAVILQEIADADESLGSRADDLLSAALFAGHRLAANVTGTSGDVQQLTRAQVLDFRDRQWSPAGGVAVITGDLGHIDRARVQATLGRIPDRRRPPRPVPLPPFTPRTEIEPCDGEVVHLRLAYQVPGVDVRRRRDRAVAEVFSQLIGGPMGSRLCDELREQRGLCYWIDAHVWGYESATFLSVSCSVGPADVDEVFTRVQSIVGHLSANGPTEEEVCRFRAYSAGAATLDFEAIGLRMDYAIELIMEYDDHELDPHRHIQELESVDRSELTALAADINPRPSVACVGPTHPADIT
ncbi:MAG: M16 family metallopeptidase [Solirubrobacteraceae bacterium]